MLEKLAPRRIIRSLGHRGRTAWQQFRTRLRTAARRTQLWWSLHRNLGRIRRLRARLSAGERIVAIVLVEHVGDIVACEPVARYLRSRGARDTLVWIVRSSYLELLDAHPDLTACLPVTSLTEAMALAKRPVFDEVINLHVNGRECRWSGAVFEKTSGDPRITLDNYYDYGSLLEAFSRSAGLPALADAPRFHFHLRNWAELDRLLPRRPYLVLHATTNDRTRDWTPERWHALVAELTSETDFQLVEVGLQPVIATGANGVINLCDRLSLQELAHTIDRATGFIGVDSGPAHIANALEKSALILLGHYVRWQTYMPYTGYLRAHAAQMLLQWNGRVADIPVAVCMDRIRILWNQNVRSDHPRLPVTAMKERPA